MKVIIRVSLFVMLSLVFVSASEYKKSEAVLKKIQRKVNVESNYTSAIYKARVKLELGLKRIDQEFKSLHNEYSKIRKEYQDDHSNKDKQKAYYKKLDEMALVLLKKAKASSSLSDEYKAYTSAVKDLRKRTFELIKKAKDRREYQAAAAVVDKDL